jgi:hypothetical protein
MRPNFVLSRLGGAVLLGAACLLLFAAPSAAQTSSGAIRGYVTTAGGVPVSGAEVQVQNLASGVTRSTTSGTNGFYNLPGLTPGTYQLMTRQIGYQPQTREVTVRIGQTVQLNTELSETTVQLEELLVQGESPIDMRTSEVATNVTPQQIEELPSANRNFLDLAALAPGTSLQGTRINDTRRTFSAGAQGADQINVFIDGASYKNDILQGGVAGQDASRGNPFPRNAVQEFRVLTQNYKAEYQKASSAIITAATKSGTNEWAGNAFLTYQNEGLVARDTFFIRDQSTNPDLEKPEYERFLMGISLGGPIIRDRLHFFGSYEGNRQDRASRVNIVPPTGFPALDTIDFASRNGAFGSPFRSTLLFGKLTYAVSERSSAELSYNHRTENDIRDFGGNTAFEAATRFNNDVNTLAARYDYFAGPILNETQISYQRYRYNPTAENPGPIARLYGFGCCARIGSHNTEQDFTQKRLSIRDDLTYSGVELAGSHVFKVGGNLDFLNYDVIKRNAEVPLFVYEPWFNNFEIPERVEFQTGDPNFSADNTQLGLYAQDDWSPTPRLTLNLGMRWDFETNMMNYDYVTPQPIIDAVNNFNDQFFLPIDTDRYFTDGTERDKWYGAIQPRLGASFALDDEQRTVIFGGWGIFYDRTLFDQALEESFALQHPSYLIRFKPVGDPDPGRFEWDPTYLEGREPLEELLNDAAANRPEAKLLPNDLRPPKSQQFSLGIRHLFGAVAVEAAYTGVRSENVMTFYWANVDRPLCPDPNPDGLTCEQRVDVPGFSNILIADDAGKTWYDALQVKVDRGYQQLESGYGWGAGLAYTLANRQSEGFNDLFSFPNPRFFGRQDRNDERHRVVAHWTVGFPQLGGFQFSGIGTYGSGLNLDVGDRVQPSWDPAAFDTPASLVLDLRLRKDFPVMRGSRVSVTGDLFNVTNEQTLGCYSTFDPNAEDFGNAGCTINDPRRFQLGLEYDF